MASFHHKDTDDRKASGLPDNIRGAMTGGATPAEAPKSTRGAGKTVLGQRENRLWVSVLVDVILLLVLAGLVVGAWFGFRAVRELYAPTWETRTVIYRVEINGVDPASVKYGADDQVIYLNHPIWSSDRTDADMLGTVIRVDSERRTDENGRNTLTLYLTVEADTSYREGKGYRMGETMLLAGLEGEFRLEGMLAQGTVISVYEAGEAPVDGAESVAKNRG